MLSPFQTRIIVLFAVIIFSLGSIIPLLMPGFFTTDDGNWMVIRFSAFYQALAEGQFPVRWLTRLNQSYGYPVANFLYPGFMYLGIPLKLIGLSFLDSVKTLMAISMLTSGVFCYLWLRQRFSLFPSSVAAILYVYFPYHIYDLYQRGSVGELLALSIAPFVLWQLARKSFVFSTLGIFLLILSHNSLAFMFLLVTAIYVILKKDFRKIYIWYFTTIILGVSLAAFFWIPALFDLSSTVFFETTVSEWSGYFADISLVGFTLPLIFITSLLIFAKKRNLVSSDKTTLYFFILGLMSLFFATKISSIFWEILPVSFIQFPFRFLSIVILCGAFLGAYCIENIQNHKTKIAVAILFLLLLYPSLIRIVNVENYPVNDDVLATNEDTTTVKSEYMPIWVREIPKVRPESFFVLNDTQTDLITRPTANMNFEVSTQSKVNARISQFYFPGWKVIVNGQERQINYMSDGLISFTLDPGINKVNVVFKETGSRLIADGVSVGAFFLLVIIGWIFKIKKYGKDTKIF